MQDHPRLGVLPLPCDGPRTRSCSIRGERGQALVEFALVLPLLLLTIFGILDFGKAYNYKNDLNFIANQAARYAEVNSCGPCTAGDPNPIADYVKSTADTSQLANGTTICFSLPAGSQGRSGDALQVTASYSYNWLSFLSAHGLPTSSTIKSTVTVRILTASDGTLYTTQASC